METIEPAPIEVVKKNSRAYWDISERLTRVLAIHDQERHQPLARLLVMLGAYNCLGCERLEAQIETHGAALGERTEVVKAMGGDLDAWDFFQDLIIGDASISTPGVPLGILFDVANAGTLVFRALTLGPFRETATAEVFGRFAAGESQWVEEAAGATVVFCHGPLCVGLDRTNNFHQPFTVNLAAAR